MDAIRKKMKSLKDETEGLYAIIHKFEEETADSNKRFNQAECDIRDYVSNLRLALKIPLINLTKPMGVMKRRIKYIEKLKETYLLLHVELC